jgi:Endopolygalacturonase
MVALLMKRFYYFIWIFILLTTGVACTRNNPYIDLYKNLPFEMPVLERPKFPENVIRITEYGGIPDGKTLNTAAFEKAIRDLADKGGGTLIVPSGIWFTGPITFRSNINLHLEKGALILFSPDFDLYPLVKTIYEGRSGWRCQSPISGRNLENIAITGKGAINGSGEAWRPLKRIKVTDTYWNKVVQSGGVLKDPGLWFPTPQALKGDTINPKPSTEEEWMAIKDFLRPVMISFIECKNVLLEGVLFENSPAWNIHPLLCENVIIDNIDVRNPSYSQNGDGLDIESCKNVIITDCSFDVGDDAICIKSGKDEEGRRRGRPTENVIIENCRVFKGHGGFVVGSEMSGGVKNISVSDCQFMGTDIGLRFKSARGRGGVVENIYINNINMFDILQEPISFNLYYFTEASDSVPPVDETTPVLKDIYINGIIARNANKAMLFYGLPEMNISNINIENVIITAQSGAELSETENIHFRKVEVYPEKGPALVLHNVKNMYVSEFKYPENKESILITGERSKNINIPGHTTN